MVEENTRMNIVEKKRRGRQSRSWRVDVNEAMTSRGLNEYISRPKEMKTRNAETINVIEILWNIVLGKQKRVEDRIN